MADEARFDLSPKQRKAIESILSGNELEVAAAAAGVSPSTIYRWRRSDEFQAALRASQAELVQDHVTALSGMLRGNRDVLLAIRDDSGTPAHVRLRAVELIESTLRSWKEFADFEDRLAELERMVGNV